MLVKQCHEPPIGELWYYTIYLWWFTHITVNPSTMFCCHVFHFVFLRVCKLQPGTVNDNCACYVDNVFFLLHARPWSQQVKTRIVLWITSNMQKQRSTTHRLRWVSRRSKGAKSRFELSQKRRWPRSGWAVAYGTYQKTSWDIDGYWTFGSLSGCGQGW